MGLLMVGQLTCMAGGCAAGADAEITPPLAKVVSTVPAVEDAAALRLARAQEAKAEGYPALMAYVDEPTKVIHYAISPEGDSQEAKLFSYINTGEIYKFENLLKEGADANALGIYYHHKHPITLLDYCLDQCRYGFFISDVLKHGGRLDLLSDQGIYRALTSIDTTKGNLLLAYGLPLTKKLKPFAGFADTEITILSLIIDRYYEKVTSYCPDTGGEPWCMDVFRSIRYMNIEGLITEVAPSGKTFIEDAIELTKAKEAALEAKPAKHAAICKPKADATLAEILSGEHRFGKCLYVPSLAAFFARLAAGGS